jgi:Xaa-Pro aminopeptidase
MQSPKADYPCAVPYDAATRSQWIDWVVPQAEYEERVARVRFEMATLGLDALLVAGHEGDPASLAWLTNYTSRFGHTWLLLPLEGEPAVVTDAILHGEPMHSMLWNIWLPDVRAASTRKGKPPGSICQRFAEVVHERGLARGRIGVCSSWTIAAAHADGLRRELPDTIWTDATAAVMRPRAIKSDAEIVHMRRACEITATGLSTALEAARAGVTEREVANVAQAALFSNGAEELGFDTAVSSGPRAGLKHASPTGRVMQAGEMVFLDMGAVVRGYHADMSRCTGVWPIDVRAQQLFDAAQAIFEDAIAAVRPGNSVQDIYRAAENAARREGVIDDYMPNGLGHGLGLSLWELPFLTPDDETILEAGMIFALEPMLVRYGLGTAVIEETVLVTRSGAETLSGMPW